MVKTNFVPHEEIPESDAIIDYSYFFYNGYFRRDSESLQDFLSVMLGLSFFLFAAAAVITLFGNRSTGISLERLNK